MRLIGEARRKRAREVREKAFASSGMSTARSRSGGSTMLMVFTQR
jgi:hypothetical protein